jgi:hypothetical protein
MRNSKTNLQRRGDSSNQPPASGAKISTDAVRSKGSGKVKAWLVALTDFGDLAVLIPLAAVMLVWLLFILCVQHRTDFCSGFRVGATALLKIAFFMLVCLWAACIARAVTRASAL